MLIAISTVVFLYLLEATFYLMMYIPYFANKAINFISSNNNIYTLAHYILSGLKALAWISTSISFVIFCIKKHQADLEVPNPSGEISDAPT